MKFSAGCLISGNDAVIFIVSQKIAILATTLPRAWKSGALGLDAVFRKRGRAAL